MKFKKITIVFLLDLVEDERTFSIFAFMKTKYAIGWGNIWIQLFACLHKSSLLKRTFLIMRPLLVEKNKKYELVLPFKNGCWALISLLCLSAFVSMIWTSMVMLCSNFIMIFVNIWVWWLGLWIAADKVYYLIRVQLPLKVLMCMCKLERTLLLCHLSNHISLLWWTK